jgi:2-oxoisovalerate dehydrogenase E1 component beta subunit
MISRVARPVKFARFSTAAAGETKKMNLFTAVNDAMRVALETDPTAVVFGEVNT